MKKVDFFTKFFLFIFPFSSFVFVFFVITRLNLSGRAAPESAYPFLYQEILSNICIVCCVISLIFSTMALCHLVEKTFFDLQTKAFSFLFPACFLFFLFDYMFFVIAKSPATYYDLDSIIPLLGCLLALVLFLWEKSEYKKDMEHTQQ